MIWSELSFGKILPAMGCILGDGRREDTQTGSGRLHLSWGWPGESQNSHKSKLSDHLKFSQYAYTPLSHFACKTPNFKSQKVLSYSMMPCWALKTRLDVLLSLPVHLPVSTSPSPPLDGKLFDGCAHSLFIMALVPSTELSVENMIWQGFLQRTNGSLLSLGRTAWSSPTSVEFFLWFLLKHSRDHFQDWRSVHIPAWSQFNNTPPHTHP